jgi:penicillin-binding protein 2
MTERPRVLIELGEELDRAAQRTLTAPRGRRFGRVNAGGVLAGVAAAAAVAVAVAAIVVIGHRHGASGAPASRPAAPRGEITGGDGQVLVGGHTRFDVRIVPAKLPVPLRDPTLTQLAKPPRADESVYDQLGRVLHMSHALGSCVFDGHTLSLRPVACEVAVALHALPYANVTVDKPVSKATAVRVAAKRLPGVTESTIFTTTYPHGDLAAQTLGTVGPITAQEVHEPAFRGDSQDAIVGQTGLESFYDHYLSEGDTLKTSLDLRLEQTAQASLAHSIARNAAPHAGGAFVAMDPQNGQVYAMGSLPTFNPTVFTKPISNGQYQRMFGSPSNAPLVNRAIAGLYPVGSTFKPITATAALERGVWNPDQTYDDTGSFNLDGEVLHNAGRGAYGDLNLVQALQVSDDIFFFHLAALLNANPLTHPQGGALQMWARRYGLGEPTGIDLPGEASGLVPSPAVIKDLYNEELACEQRRHVTFCGMADTGAWTIGDNINVGVGQGDDQVTPLQLAVVYAAIANGGTVVRPHLGSQIESSGGALLQTIEPPPVRHLEIEPAYLAAIQRGLRQAASAPGGTSADVMANFPEPISGMAGTAETPVNGRETDQAWYAAYVPASATNKPIVVVVTVERGGYGAVAAAPVARQILSQWFLGKPGPYVPGTSTTL